MKTENIKKVWAAYQEVQEKLKGDQHKLDMDKDGDIDATDFKHMRKKKANENDEVEMNPTLKDKKNKKNVEPEMAAEAKLEKEEVEQIDEISNEKKKEYLRHVADKGGIFKKPKPASLYGLERKSKEELKKIKRPTIGDVLDRAEKLNKRKKIALKVANSLTKEEVEQVDEISKEETGWTVYERILENRAAHYKGATAPETSDDKLKGAGAKKMKSDYAGNAADPDFEEKGHDDASKAGRITKKSPARNADQSKGDSTIINKPEDVTKKGQG